MSTQAGAHEFDGAYWENHWRGASGTGKEPNPYLVRETAGLNPGTALDAGCGEGGEARWLASRGWDVTAADISAEALTRAAGAGDAAKVEWVRADLTTWTPASRFDLVVTHYAHPSMPQLAFYERVAGWVKPGGTLLVVGHLHAGGAAGHGHGHGSRPPAEASVTAADITARLDPAGWTVVTAEERSRTLTAPNGRSVSLHDVVVRATRHR
ncbi:class I SAM-dependent methyltransferase [Amycolatopsis samaneae]|uniref:Class I SAM-dependent methyltransferase n=1 Tax=Amycolatopsis samaneae TaxID=664691 RepID=A0ABW5GSK8_9PSEU